MVNILLVKKVVCKIVCWMVMNKVCWSCVCIFLCRVEEVIVFGDQFVVNDVFKVVQLEIMCVVFKGVMYVNMVLCKVFCFNVCIKVFGV